MVFWNLRKKKKRSSGKLSAYSDLQNRVAAGFILCFRGLGLFLNKQKTTHLRFGRNGWFLWSEDILEISGSDGLDSEFVPYHFQTDNPGLQQLYNGVIELGIDFPAVPMWLPEGAKLIGCKRVLTTKAESLSAVFMHEDIEISYKAVIYNEEVSHEYYITEPNYVPHEFFGVTYYITNNFDRWIVIWSQEENIECSFTIDCTEDTLHRIIQSIYVREDAY